MALLESTELASRSRYFVILLKGSVDDEEVDGDVAYREALAPAVSRRIPVLSFESIAEGTRTVVSKDYDAIIATSARAIWALRQHLNEAELRRLSTLTWFVVGKGTAEILQKDLGVDSILGQESGNAERLIEFLRRLKKPPKQLCFVCGNLRRSTIEDGLHELGIPFDTTVVYRTIPVKRTQLPAAERGLQRVCAFFSPSGVTAAAAEIQPDDKLLAIGQTTAHALQERGFTVSAVATEPTSEGLAKALDSL